MAPKITRQILGQKVEIGTLYNACKDAIIDSNVFDSELLKELIKTKTKVTKTFTITTSDLIPDKYAALGLSAETSVGVAVGFIAPTGPSELFLSAVSPTSSQTHTVTAICTVQTKVDTLDTGSDGLEDAVNTQILAENDEATHVVVGVTRGARLAASLQNTDPVTVVGQIDEISGHLGRLASEIGRCFNIPDSERDALVPEAELVDLSEKYELKARSDLVLKGSKTTTYEDTCKFAASMTAAPGLKKASAPLSVDLMPIKDFLDLVNASNVEPAIEVAFFKQVDEALLKQTIEISDKIALGRKAFGDLLAIFKAYKGCLPEGQLDKFADDKTIDKFEAKFRSEVGDALATARSEGNSKTSSKLRAVLAEYAPGGKKDPYMVLNARLQPWATKISCISEAAAAGIPVSTLVALTATPNMKTAEVDETKPRDGDSLLEGDVYAFYISAAATSSPLFDKNKSKAYELVGDPNKKNRVVIVDLDTDKAAATFKGVAPCIQLRRNGKGILPDVVADEEELGKMCLIRCKPSASSPPSNGPVSVLLENRLPVLMACPHPACLKSTTAAAPDTWMCPTCKEQVTFGCNKVQNHYHMYCNCGSYDISSAEFRCNNKVTHGSGFVPITPAEGESVDAAKARFRDQLCKMKPFEQYNILIIGASGAGKSTFINAFVNYLLYDSLEDAMDAEQLTFAIPGSFDVQHPTIADKKVQISWGSENEKEAFSTGGQSATQSCVIYAINFNGKLVRLVDTPGLGDTRGIDQDYKNVSDIMRILESLSTISSILFLVKNNETRLTTSFDYVMSELMMHLHRDTVKNIMFGFSYGRTSIPPFAVGNVGAPLIDLLKRKKLPMQQLITDKNAFVFDAEGFLNVAAWQQKQLLMAKTPEAKATIAESWRISAEKTQLMISVTMKLPKHDTKETLGLERNRRLVDGMGKTMVDMSRGMDKTYDELNKKLAEIAELEKEGKNLGPEKMQYELVSLVNEKLSQPRTVCKEAGCASTKIDPRSNMPALVFDKSCHSPCYVNTPEERYGIPELSGCQCFDAEGSNCNICRHPYTSHCHISYLQVFKKEIITEVKEDIVQKKKQNHDEKSRAEAWKAKLEADKAEVESEQKKVQTTMVRFSIYVGANSVTAYNDGVVEHLRYLEENAKKDNKPELLKQFKDKREEHEKLIKERQDLINANKDSVPTNADIEKMLADLKAMKMYGGAFKALLERKEAEVPYQAAVPIKVAKTGSWGRLGRWLGV